MRKNTEITEVENVSVHKAAEFQGYTVLFSIHGQRGKKVLQVPVGQQVCRVLQHREKELLAYLKDVLEEHLPLLNRNA